MNENCLIRVKTALENKKVKVSDERLNELLDQVNGAEMAAGGNRTAFRALVNELADREISLRETKARIAAKQMLQIKASVIRAVARPNEQVPAFDRIRSWLLGRGIKGFEGSNLSPSDIRAAVYGPLGRTWSRLLEPYKVQIESGKLDRELYQALHLLGQGAKDAELAHLPEAAVTVAKGIRGLQEEIFNLKAAHTPFIERVQDYLTQRFHDRAKISQVDKAVWIADAKKAYRFRDEASMSKAGTGSYAEGMVGPKSQIDSAWSDLYDRIKGGTFDNSVMDDESIASRGLGSPTDIQRRMARGRSLVGISPDLEYEYNAKYGYGTVAESVHRSIEQAARDVSVLKKFSATPKALYESVYQATHAMAPEAEKRILEGRKAALDADFAAATGRMDSPAEGGVRRTALAAIGVQTLRLGGALLNSAGDIPLSAFMLRKWNGKGIISNLAEFFPKYLSYMLPFGKDSKAALEALTIYTHSRSQSLLREIGTGGGQGWVSKFADATGTLSLLNRHTESARAAMGDVISGYLAKSLDTPYEQLSDRWKNGLVRYGIGQQEWKLFTQAIQDPESSGVKSDLPFKTQFLSSDGIRALSDEALSKYMVDKGIVKTDGVVKKAAIENVRTDLALKLGAMINEHADQASSTSSLRERRFLYLGRSANDNLGLALRMVNQFHGASLSTFDAARQAYHSGGKKGDLAGVMGWAGASFVFTAMAEWSKDLLQGKEPSGLDADFLERVAAKSSVGGLMSDIIGQAMQEGPEHTALSLAGPLPGSMIELGVALGHIAGSGDDEAKRGRAERRIFDQGVNNLVPFYSLFYMRKALNFLFLDGIREQLDAGYLSRLQQRTEKKPGLFTENQSYLAPQLAPTEALNQ